jgi:cytochrome bd ubiquinol oxidase subunit I
MNPEILSRIQFALTVSFHYIYPPISMGLGLILVIFGVLYVRTKEQKWRELSFYWLKIYSLVFALGIATGVVQEFEFGMNWSTYSRFVGNIFGSLLAAEGVFASAAVASARASGYWPPRLSSSARTSARCGSSWPTRGCRHPLATRSSRRRTGRSP